MNQNPMSPSPTNQPSMYQQSLQKGLTDEDLINEFTKRDPEFTQKYQKATQLGATPEQIFTLAHESYKKKEQAQPPQEQEEDIDIDKEIQRHTARLTSRGLEQVVGLPGNVRDAAVALKDFYQKNKPKYIPDIKEPEGLKKFEEFLPIGETISNLLGYLPTSKDVKKFSEEKSLGYTKPQGRLEEVGDEVFENIVSSALPGQGQRNVWRNIAAPIAGVLGKEAVKEIGGTEKSQALTQLGLNIALPLMAGNAPQLNKDTWKNVRQTIPKVEIATQNFLQRTQALRQKIQKGLGSKSENQALKTLDVLEDKLKGGKISAEELMASNISLNEIVGDPELFGKGGHWFEEMRGIIRDGMEEVGKHSPEWYKEWQKANEIHGAIANSNYIARTVKKHTSPLLSEGARALFHGAVHGTAKAAAIIPPVYLIYKGTQVINRMANSPHLLQYYTNVMKNALKGNVASMSSNLNKLDNALLKQEEKEEAKKGHHTSSSPKK